MKLRRRHLTLLEVMISFTLLALCLYPLLSPHVDYYKAQKQLSAYMRTNISLNNWYAEFYERILAGEEVVEDEDFPLDLVGEKATYRVELVNEKKGINQAVMLLKVIVHTQTSGEFNYFIITTRATNEN